MIPLHSDIRQDLKYTQFNRRSFYCVLFYIIPILILLIDFEVLGIRPHPTFLIFACFLTIGIVIRKFLLINGKSPKYHNARSILLTSYRAFAVNVLLLALLVFVVSKAGSNILPEKIDLAFILNIAVAITYAFFWHRFSLAFFNYETAYRQEVYKGMELKRTVY